MTGDDDDDFSNSQALAQLGLLTLLVRQLLKERAIAIGQTKEDVLKWAEEIKQASDKSQNAEAGMFFSAAVDRFFKSLAEQVGRPGSSED